MSEPEVSKIEEETPSRAELRARSSHKKFKRNSGQYMGQNSKPKIHTCENAL
jgi:hypothetical protein